MNESVQNYFFTSSQMSWFCQEVVKSSYSFPNAKLINLEQIAIIT
jgi:hypothetical protein